MTAGVRDSDGPVSPAGGTVPAPADLLSRVLSNLAAGVLMVDRDGVITFANPAALRILGLDEAAIVGRTYAELQVAAFDTSGTPLAADRGLVPSLRRDAKASAQVVRRYEGFPAGTRWLESSAMPLLDSGGLPQGAVLSFTDVTARCTLDAERLAAERRLDDILRFSANGIVMVDTVSRIEYANAAAVEILGLRRDEIEGRFAADSSLEQVDEHGERLPVKELPLAIVLRERREVINMQHGLRMPDGRVKWLSVSAAPLFADDGSLRGAVATLADITERRTLTEQLHQSQRIEGIGRLAGGIAHDFNNLLTTIVGNLDLSRSAVSPGSQAALALGQARAAAERGTALTRQLLTFARKQHAKPQVLRPNEVVAGVKKLLGRILGDNVVLNSFTDREPWPVFADPGQLEQVIANLAINAREAMPRGGTLTIETRNRTLGAEDIAGRPNLVPGEFVLLSVADTGTGMTHEVQRHIFEPFFTTKQAGLSSGLGLSTCYGIVQEMGGFITVESELGRGSTFRVFIPRTKVREAMRPTPIESPAKKGSGTILLVEDDAGVRSLLERALRQYGYDVLVASGGPEAIAKVGQYTGKLDLLVSDVMMAGMSGPDMAEVVLQLRPGLPVLFVSGYNEMERVHGGVLDPAVNLLSKPFTPAKLVQRVQAILASRSRAP
jgi:two-component system cell cycle sensor histidine kinase/response regulator CckA